MKPSTSSVPPAFHAPNAPLSMITDWHSSAHCAIGAGSPNDTHACLPASAICAFTRPLNGTPW